MSVKTKKHIVYWIFPTALIALYTIIYFYDTLGLAFIIAPEFNRELGIVENTQLLIILGMFLVSVKAFKIDKIALHKIVYAGIAIFSIFIFLEEIDYGIHILDYFDGKSDADIRAESKGSQIRNIHNQGKLNHYFKLTLYISFVLFLVVYPVAAKRFKIANPYLNKIVPSNNFIYPLISMAILNQFAFYLDDAIEHSNIVSLHLNISEFEEIFIYYIMLLYVVELVNKNTPNWKKEK